MIAGMIIGIAAQDVKYQSPKKLAQAGFGVGEAVAYDFGKLLITCIAGHHFVKFEDGQRGHKRAAMPNIAAAASFAARS